MVACRIYCASPGHGHGLAARRLRDEETTLIRNDNYEESRLSIDAWMCISSEEMLEIFNQTYDARIHQVALKYTEESLLIINQPRCLNWNIH